MWFGLICSPEGRLYIFFPNSWQSIQLIFHLRPLMSTCGATRGGVIQSLMATYPIIVGIKSIKPGSKWCFDDSLTDQLCYPGATPAAWLRYSHSGTSTVFFSHCYIHAHIISCFKDEIMYPCKYVDKGDNGCTGSNPSYDQQDWKEFMWWSRRTHI